MNSSTLQVAIALAQAVALLMSVAFISYALIILIPYMRFRPAPAGDARTLNWHLFVPALNEERVVGGTIDYLRATFPTTHLWVIDGDGRPAPNCLDVCAGARMFGDPGVGSVQVQVRMLNRDDRRPFPHRGRLVNALGHALVRLQHLEFRVPISAIQITRRFTSSVGLGGNGQFSRLSALDVVADEYGPWRGALLEDYELSLHLMMTGHRNEYTQDTSIDQEALPDIRRLVRQRTRWGQAPCSAAPSCAGCGPPGPSRRSGRWRPPITWSSRGFS